MKGSTLLIIGGAVAAYLYLSKQGQGDGGQGGSLNIPTLSDIIGSSSPTSAPATDPAVTTTQSTSPISPIIAAAQSLFQVPGGYSVPSTANANPTYGTQYGYGSTGYFSPGTAPGTFFGSDPTGQKQSQADAFYAKTAAYNKKASAPSPISIGNFTSQGGGNYTGNVPVAKKSGGTVHSYSSSKGWS